MDDNSALEHAWNRFGAFDAAAVTNQNRFLLLRRLILIGGICAASAGLATSTAVAAIAADPHSAWAVVHPWMKWVTVTCSLMLTGLFVVAARLDRGNAWVVSRRSAELIRREIFMFRTRAGRYRIASDALQQNVNALLATQLRALNQDSPEAQRFGPSKEGEFPPQPAMSGKNRAILGNGKPDDGLCPLSTADYTKHRVEQQRDWYRGKAKGLRYAATLWEIGAIAIGLAGAALAAIGGMWTGWVAITTAVAAAVTSWTETKRLEPNAVAYERTASVLDDLLVWWKALTVAEKADTTNVERLVAECEAAIESENSSWTQDMRKRISELVADAEKRSTPSKPES